MYPLNFTLKGFIIVVGIALILFLIFKLYAMFRKTPSFV